VGDPFGIWMIGGLGCSNEFVVFYKNGPSKIIVKLTMSWNVILPLSL
jgi:carboxypeptidase C (cathepsin A)